MRSMSHKTSWSFCPCKSRFVFMQRQTSSLWSFLDICGRFQILVLTLKRSLPYVLKFMVCASILYLGFLFCGWVVLGPYHHKFRKYAAVIGVVVWKSDCDEILWCCCWFTALCSFHVWTLRWWPDLFHLFNVNPIKPYQHSRPPLKFIQNNQNIKYSLYKCGCAAVFNKCNCFELQSFATCRFRGGELSWVDFIWW